MNKLIKSIIISFKIGVNQGIADSLEKQIDQLTIEMQQASNCTHMQIINSIIKVTEERLSERELVIKYLKAKREALK